MNVKNFNLRVYGLLFNDKGEILISHENRSGFKMLKFPGGGLEKGEGLKDCLIREFVEEAGVDIVPTELFYVNDFLQISAFNQQDQLISFYYLVNAMPNEVSKIVTKNENMGGSNDSQYFEWLSITMLKPELFTFPIDKVVVDLIIERKK